VVWRRTIATDYDEEVITEWCLSERGRRAAVRQLVLDGRKNDALENLEVLGHIRWLANTASSCKNRVIGF
jgi:hypothetical protein